MSNNVKYLVDTRLSNLTVSPELQQKLLQGLPQAHAPVYVAPQQPSEQNERPTAQPAAPQHEQAVSLVRQGNLENKVEQAAGLSRSRPRRRIMTALIAAVLCLVLTFSVFATTVPTVRTAVQEFFTNIISPQLEEEMAPVISYCEDNGIRLDMISAASDGENMLLLLTLQDVEQDRLAELMDIFVLVNDQSYIPCASIDYDPQSKTALVALILIELEYHGETMQFGVEGIRTESLYEHINFNVALSEVTGEPVNTVTKEWETFAEPPDTDMVTLLEARSVPIGQSGVDEIFVTNIGYIDGKLHVQVLNTKANQVSGWGTVWLAWNEDFAYDAAGMLGDGAYDPIEEYRYFVDETGEQVYTEAVFDVPVEVLYQYTVAGINFSTYETIHGNWSVDITANAMETVELYTDLHIRNATLKHIVVSPFVIKIVTANELFDGIIVVEMKDGTFFTITNQSTMGTDYREGVDGFVAWIPLTTCIYEDGQEAYRFEGFQLDEIAEIYIDDVPIGYTYG